MPDNTVPLPTAATSDEGGWPKFFPKSCPPADATPGGGPYFRLVVADPPSASDFKPWCVENGRLDPKKPCVSCAVSVFDDLNDVRRMQARVPGQRGKSVARGEVHADLGVSKATPTRSHHSHRSWWVPQDVDPSAAFKVVAPPYTEGSQ